MPKLICPKCMKTVEVPDDFTGREVTCPACATSFDAPAKYTPAVLSAPAPVAPAPQVASAPAPIPEPPRMPHAAAPPPPAPPGYVLPAHASVVASAPLPAGYTRSCSISVSPMLVAWLPAILLSITLLCTFFPWVGTYLGGYPVYSQGPWRAMFGSVNRNFALEGKLQIPGGWLDQLRSDWELLVPAMLLLVLAFCLAWADRGLRALDPRKIPPLVRFWKYRQAIIAILAVGSFTFLLVQTCDGFGLQRAIRRMVSEQFAKERAEAGVSQSKIAEVEYKEEQELMRYNLERTTWLYLALLCNLFAALAMLTHIVLERRGAKPPPRFVFQY